MKRLLVLSGKGGTGKTTVASCIIAFSEAKAFADCDVDAPNLHLVTGVKEPVKVSDYYGGQKALIDSKKCIGCMKCEKVCKFGAISIKDNKAVVNQYSCEGCGVCKLVCRNSAVSLCDDKAGKLFLYKDKATFSTAELKIGRGTSGKLVSEVKKQLNDNTDKNTPFAVIDGSPGIGCPVIASISGVSVVLIVTEPSQSGISDLERIVKTAQNFGVKICVCVNKADTCKANADRIKNYCDEKDIEFCGFIPYDSNVSRAINKGQNIAGMDCPAKNAVYDIYSKVKKYL